MVLLLKTLLVVLTFCALAIFSGRCVPVCGAVLLDCGAARELEPIHTMPTTDTRLLSGILVFVCVRRSLGLSSTARWLFGVVRFIIQP